MAGKKRASSGENGDAPKEKKNKNQTEFSNLDFSTKKCDFKVMTFCRGEEVFTPYIVHLLC